MAHLKIMDIIEYPGKQEVTKVTQQHFVGAVTGLKRLIHETKEDSQNYMLMYTNMTNKYKYTNTLHTNISILETCLLN